jgi:hypothetical protein
MNSRLAGSGYSLGKTRPSHAIASTVISALCLATASAVAAACGRVAEVSTGETCMFAVTTKPERAVVLLGDTVLFVATFLRECDVQVPFRWSTKPVVLGDFTSRSDTSAVFRAHTLGMAVVDIEDPRGRSVGQASVEVRAQ